MKPWLQHPIRATARGMWMCAELARAAWSFLLRCAFRPEDGRIARRGAWLQESSRRFIRVLRLTTQVDGAIPSRGLLICNHLSYVDVLVLAALTPAVFVAKSEIRRWPVFGWFARLANTVFVDRSRRVDAVGTARAMERIIDAGGLVILFPEGTSSGGQDVLPFKSALLEPAVGLRCQVTVGLISYALEDGDPAEEVCYWKDMTLLPHLVNLLSKRVVRATVKFTPMTGAFADRKELARRSHAQVLSLKAAL